MTNVLTKQELFNTAYVGLAKQGWKRATDIFGRCRYRTTDDGLKCAIGHAIPDDKYDPGLEGCSPRMALMYSGLTITDIDAYFCNGLQKAHDRATDETLQERMKAFAEDNQLNIPRVKAQ